MRRPTMTTTKLPVPKIATRSRPTPPPIPVPKRLTFAPMAWLKLQYLCHAGPTEVAAFGMASDDAPLRLEDILVVRQQATAATVAFDDEAVADLFDSMVDV